MIILKIFLLLIFCIFVYGRGPQVTCRRDTDSYGPKCILDDVTSEDGHLEIAGDKNTKGVVLRNSDVKVITSDICDTFQKTRNLEINSVRAKAIGYHPFDNCRGLAYLWIINNKLTGIKGEVDRRIFRNNKKLEFLSLYNNDIKSLTDAGDILGDLTSLQQLWLTQNCLVDFPKSLMLKLNKNIRLIFVDQNHLKDLDAESMVKIFKNLAHVHFMNVDIPKKRAKKINEIFKAHDIRTDYDNWNPFKKYCP